MASRKDNVLCIEFSSDDGPTRPYDDQTVCINLPSRQIIRKLYEILAETHGNFDYKLELGYDSYVDRNTTQKIMLLETYNITREFVDKFAVLEYMDKHEKIMAAICEHINEKNE